jgi:hypothetical protein
LLETNIVACFAGEILGTASDTNGEFCHVKMCRRAGVTLMFFMLGFILYISNNGLDYYELNKRQSLSPFG